MLVVEDRFFIAKFNHAVMLRVQAVRRLRSVQYIRSSIPTRVLSTSTSSDSRTDSSNNNQNDDRQTHFGYQQVPLSDKQRLVSGVFSSVAQRYDVMNDMMSLGVHRLWKDTFVSDISPSSTMKILDCAGGTGDIAFRLLRSTSPSPSPSVTVCDINDDMLSVGRSRDKKNQLTFVQADAQKLPFEDEQFDVYTIAFGMRNVPDTDKALQEARRVLKKGGRFCMLEFAKVRAPVLKEAYEGWSFGVIPRIGEAVAGDRESYQYLVESIRKFPAQEDFVRIMVRNGFAHATYKDYSFGIVSSYTGYKL